MSKSQVKKCAFPIDRILRLPEVMRITGLSKPSIYRLMEMGKFPKAVKISLRAIGWRESVIRKRQDNLEEVV